MDQSENSLFKRSQIRPPSKIPSPGKGLCEISESQSNARSKISAIPPPQMSAKLNGLSSSIRLVNEPEPKRKTLVERAGEPVKSSSIAVAPRPQVKGTSLLGARNTSFASSVSSRPQSTSSRNASNSSFASSMGPGSRPPSYSSRPQTSMAFSQSTTTRPSHTSRPQTSMASKRPASSMDDHMETGGGPADGKRKGMIPISTPSPVQFTAQYGSLQYKKVRSKHSAQNLKTHQDGSSHREMSVTAALSKLRLDDSSDFEKSLEVSRIPKVVPGSIKVSKSLKPSNLAAVRKSKFERLGASLFSSQRGERSLVTPCTPSRIPIYSRAEASRATPATPCRISKHSTSKLQYLTKDSNLPSFLAWDLRGRLEDMETMYFELKDTMTGTSMERSGLEETVAKFKAKLIELDSMKTQLESKNVSLQTDLDATRQRLLITTASLDDERRTLDDERRTVDNERRAHRVALEDQSRELRHELDYLRRELTEDRQQEVDRVRRELTEEIERLIRLHREELRELEKRSSQDLEDERRRRLQEVEDIKSQLAAEQQNLGMEMGSKDRVIQNMRAELEDVRGELDREQILKSNLQQTLAESSSKTMTLESSVRSLQKHVDFLESGSKAQSDSFVSLERQLQEALQAARESKEKLIKEETLRRILFNQVQELKGNIRVMCRVRPTTEIEENEAAKIAFPDVEKESKELEIQGPEEKSSLGNVTRKTSAFSFDRVFGPSTQNEEIFGEISQLVQSALDGYNVCIFCYGQTGSGKTYTMSSADGMIPRATHMIYEKATSLQEKGWTYAMEGSFVEVYNEEIHDLLGNPKEFDKKKHEIRHDEQKKQTTITGLKTVPLDSADTVESILKQAATNRSVAATKSNERSSRSHSIFILKLLGKNSTTNETSEGTLNLVDLAGSERLKQSGAEGDRMKETQNINKSLSCLGDVIGALGQSKEGAHIPYRNSKLTYLLQYSLGGNSKTLMFVMVSPLEAHLRETLTSLKFATKVHNTHIGTAKKSTKSG